jgi:hypothetical protein
MLPVSGNMYIKLSEVPAIKQTYFSPFDAINFNSSG